MPTELKAFEDAVRPILAMTDDDGRTKAACKALDDIRGKIVAVGKAPPTGVDATQISTSIDSRSRTRRSCA